MHCIFYDTLCFDNFFQSLLFLIKEKMSLRIKRSLILFSYSQKID